MRNVVDFGLIDSSWNGCAAIGDARFLGERHTFIENLPSECKLSSLGRQDSTSSAYCWCLVQINLQHGTNQSSLSIVDQRIEHNDQW